MVFFFPQDFSSIVDLRDVPSPDLLENTLVEGDPDEQGDFAANRFQSAGPRVEG